MKEIQPSSKPLLRGHFHQAMFFISLGACALLLAKTQTRLEFASILTYSLAVLLMFGVSTIYHRINWQPRARLWMRRMDHAGIYVMIAGSFTPITMLALPGESGTKLLFFIWGIAVFGIAQSLFFVNLPKMVSAILYMGMGFVIVPYLSELIPRLGIVNISLLLAGGVVGYAYAQRGPDSLPGCIYNASAPTLTDGQASALQCDVNGRLKTAAP